MKNPHVRLLAGLALLTSVNVALILSQRSEMPSTNLMPLSTTDRQAHKDTSSAGNAQTKALQLELYRLGDELTAMKTSLQDLQASRQSWNLGYEQDHGGSSFQSREDMVQALREQRKAQAQVEAEAFENYQAAIERKFNNQSIDSVWGLKMTNLIEQGLEAEDMKMTELVDLQCKATLCRLEVEHNSQITVEEFTFKLLEKVGHSLPDMSSKDTVIGDRTITLVYLAKRDETLI